MRAGGSDAYDPGVRRCERFMEDDPGRAADLFGRLEPHLPARLMNRSLVGLNERFRGLRYHPGDYFKPHFDAGYTRPDRSATTLVTVMLYLNDDYAGGETVMHEDGTVYRLPPGSALCFQHCQLHEGRTVEAGRKYAVRCDVFYQAQPAA